MKPIWFTEFGFPSIDKASNKPNIFYNPKSSDGGVPTHSNGRVDFAMQKRALRASLEFWHNSEFLENMICWAWDARGLGWQNLNYYADSNLWQYGHWIDGKIGNRVLCLKGKFRSLNLAIEADNLTIEDSDIEVSGDLFLKVDQNIKFLKNLKLKANRIFIKSQNLDIEAGIISTYR